MAETCELRPKKSPYTQLWHLRQKAFQHLLEVGTPIRLEQAIAFKLKSLGLVHLDANQALISCGLYKAYFRDYINRRKICDYVSLYFPRLSCGYF